MKKLINSTEMQYKILQCNIIFKIEKIFSDYCHNNPEVKKNRKIFDIPDVLDLCGVLSNDFLCEL